MRPSLLLAAAPTVAAAPAASARHAVSATPARIALHAARHDADLVAVPGTPLADVTVPERGAS